MKCLRRSDPPLPSVALDTEGAGYEAAGLLDRLMSGRICPPQRIFVPPLFVVERRSTEVTVLDDREVALALRFIHDHAGQPIAVKEVTRTSSLSRRMLELRFRGTVGRTIHEGLQRVRLERAKRLLIETGLPIRKWPRLPGSPAAATSPESFVGLWGCRRPIIRLRGIVLPLLPPGRCCPRRAMATLGPANN